MKTKFSVELKKICDIKNSLQNHQKINGTQVILSAENKEKMDKVLILLGDAAIILESIK